MSTTGHPSSLTGYDKWLSNDPAGPCASDYRVLVTVRCPGCTDPELAAPFEVDGYQDQFGRRHLRDANQACAECGADLVVLND